MASFSTIALSGLQAAQARLAVSAHNVANMNTPGFAALRVHEQVQPLAGVHVRVERATGPGVALEAEAVEQRSASLAYTANVAVLRTAQDGTGTLLDLFA